MSLAIDPSKLIIVEKNAPILSLPLLVGRHWEVAYGSPSWTSGLRRRSGLERTLEEPRQFLAAPGDGAEVQSGCRRDAIAQEPPWRRSHAGAERQSRVEAWLGACPRRATTRPAELPPVKPDMTRVHPGSPFSKSIETLAVTPRQAAWSGCAADAVRSSACRSAKGSSATSSAASRRRWLKPRRLRGSGRSVPGGGLRGGLGAGDDEDMLGVGVHHWRSIVSTAETNHRTTTTPSSKTSETCAPPYPTAPQTAGVSTCADDRGTSVTAS